LEANILSTHEECTLTNKHLTQLIADVITGTNVKRKKLHWGHWILEYLRLL